MITTLVNQDFRNNDLKNESVDLIVSSPPYKDKDGYSDTLIYEFGLQSYRTLRENSLLFVNFGHLSEDKFRPFEVCKLILDCGFKLNETITWVKNHYTPLRGDKRINNLTEFIFLFYKGEMPKLDRLSIGIPYKDKSNVKRYANGKDLKCRGNCWFIPYETRKSKETCLHPDHFPVLLPELCIKLANLSPKSIICDFFAGSGTTGVAATKLGFDFIGYETNPKFFEVAKNRLSCLKK